MFSFCDIYTHVLLVARAIKSGLRLLVQLVLGLLQHPLHLDEFSSLRVAVSTDFQQLLLPLSQLTVTLTHVECSNSCFKRPAYTQASNLKDGAAKIDFNTH